MSSQPQTLSSSGSTRLKSTSPPSPSSRLKSQSPPSPSISLHSCLSICPRAPSCPRDPSSSSSSTLLRRHNALPEIEFRNRVNGDVNENGRDNRGTSLMRSRLHSTPPSPSRSHSRSHSPRSSSSHSSCLRSEYRYDFQSPLPPTQRARSYPQLDIHQGESTMEIMKEIINIMKEILKEIINILRVEMKEKMEVKTELLWI